MPRFLQLATFYPQYLRDFYAARPGLADAPYKTQIDALLDDGFSGPHMMTREMEPFGWETFQIIANAIPAQRQWLKENDLTVPEPLNTNLVAQMQIQTFAPDVAYTQDACAFDTRFFRQVPTRPKLIMGWRGFPIPPGTDWSGMDLILTSFDAIAAAAPQFGARAVARHYPGFPMADAVPEPTGYDCDVIFSGSVTRHHGRRIALLHDIWQAAQGKGGAPFTFHLHMPDVSALAPEMQSANRGSLWGKDMVRALSRARICVNIDIDAFSAQPPNMRLIEATGAGAYLLTSHHPELPRFFTPGREIETFQDGPELLAKIRSALGDEAARRAIARAGAARCHAHNTRAQTGRAFHDMVAARLGLAGARP